MIVFAVEHHRVLDSVWRSRRKAVGRARALAAAQDRPIPPSRVSYLVSEAEKAVQDEGAESFTLRLSHLGEPAVCIVRAMPLRS